MPFTVDAANTRSTRGGDMLLEQPLLLPTPAAGSWQTDPGNNRLIEYTQLWEPALTAAAREVAEETGLAGPAVLRFHQHSVTCSEAIYPPDFHYLIAHYVALVSGRSVPVAGDDAAEIRWFSVQDL